MPMDTNQTSPNNKLLTFPIFCIVLYLIAEYARIAFLGPLKLALVAQILLAAYFLKRFDRIREVTRDRYFRYYFLLLLLMLFHVFFARNNYWAFMQFRLMITYFIISLACCLFLDSEKKLYLIISIFIFIHLLGALNWLFGMSLIGQSGPLGDENDFALAMNVAMPLSFFFGLINHGIKRMFYWTTCILLIMGNVVAGSRGGFIGLISVVALCIPFLKSKVKAMVVVGLVAVVFWFSIPESYKSDILSIASETKVETGTTGYGRTQVWDLAWHVFEHHPVVGVGQGGINFYLGEYVEEGDSADYWRIRPGQGGRATHSIYFTLLPELGLVGCILFALMIKSNIDNIRLVRINALGNYVGTAYIAIGLGVGMTGYLVTGIFLSAFYYPQFWNISAFLLSANYILKNKEMLATNI
jgi:hypothetical protein